MPQTKENALKVVEPAVAAESASERAADRLVAAPDPLVPTIFHEHWWLDTATRGTYGITEVSESGRVVGRMPYFLKSSLGMIKGIMPPLTHFLGPAVIEGEGSPDTRFLKQLEITRELIRKLPPASGYIMKCHRGVKDTLAFQRENFMTSVQFTHEIHPRPVPDIWKGMQHRRRSVITRAQKVLTPVEIRDPQVLIGFMQKNLNAYGIECNYSMEVCGKLIALSLEKQCGRILAARDPEGKLASAVFCVWDSTAYYLFITARCPSTYRGSLTLLVWEAMRDAAERNLIFDMDGVSSDESVAFFTGFGATVVPRYIVSRETKLLGIARAVQRVYKKPNFYC
jgi:hypothetical protein